MCANTQIDAKVLLRVQKALGGEFSHITTIDWDDVEREENWEQVATIAARAVIAMIDEGYFDD